MRSRIVSPMVGLCVAVTVGLGRAQDAAEPPSAAAGAGPAATAAPGAAPVRSTRASWVADARPLRVGDLITVIVDEQTSAEERVSRTATAARAKDASLHATADGQSAIGNTGVKSSLSGTSRDVGQANRSGDLAGVLTARVVAVGETGLAQIAGSREVTLDGRRQEMTLTGFVRPDDVGPTNVVHSSRIAEAKISYQGKQIGPRGGIIGRILSILWP